MIQTEFQRDCHSLSALPQKSRGSASHSNWHCAAHVSHIPWHATVQNDSRRRGGLPAAARNSDLCPGLSELRVPGGPPLAGG